MTLFSQGKDETFLCSVANFDAYMVTRIHKSPKPYVFAIKSTDSLSFFENSADYVHVFCCSEKDGQRWLESVLLARVSVICHVLVISRPHLNLSCLHRPTIYIKNATRSPRGLLPAQAEHQAKSSRARVRGRELAAHNSRC